MTPSMSINVQKTLKQEITDCAQMLSRGFSPKENIPVIVSKYISEVTDELKQVYKLSLAKKYAISLVNSYVQGVMKEINK